MAIEDRKQEWLAEEAAKRCVVLEKRIEFLMSELAATIHQYEPSISVEQAREIVEDTVKAWGNQ